MLHSRALNNRINDLHYRALRLIHQEDTTTFKEFLVKDGAVIIRQRNIKNIGIEMFKAKNNLPPKIMKEIFSDRNYSGPYLRYQVPPDNSVNSGQESLRFLGSYSLENDPWLDKQFSVFEYF